MAAVLCFLLIAKRAEGEYKHPKGVRGWGLSLPPICNDGSAAVKQGATKDVEHNEKHIEDMSANLPQGEGANGVAYKARDFGEYLYKAEALLSVLAFVIPILLTVLFCCFVVWCMLHT
jgi:hypothetical protein